MSIRYENRRHAVGDVVMAGYERLLAVAEAVKQALTPKEAARRSNSLPSRLQSAPTRSCLIVREERADA
ncbi:hypothetical protein ACGFNU_21690 [Spirillospora sp. NPDC048911]|uniref:hypothetical protein n=1 Tax=Spirillospora sp. NPDC048911 TaxID=3364527 RepID=UPI00371017BF